MLNLAYNALLDGVRLEDIELSTPAALCLTSRLTLVTLRLWKRRLSASDSGPTPRRAKRNFLARILPD